MRDILLMTILVGLWIWAVQRPFVGAMTWAWIGLMNPHTLVAGFARTLPLGQVTAIVTLLSLLAHPTQRKKLPLDGINALLFLLLTWMWVTSLFALNPQEEMVWDRAILMLKMFFMIFVTEMLVRGRQAILAMLTVLTLSVGFYGIKGGIWTALTGGANRVWGPPGGFIAGNNELGVALLMVLPLMYFLRQQARKRWQRWAWVAAMFTTGLGTLGTQSRGALLAALAIALMLSLKAKNKFATGIVVASALAMALAFMPENWNQRMSTIKTYEADSSAQSRIYGWITMWNCAVDRPLVGAGFRSDSLSVFRRYAPTDEIYEGFQNSVWVPHSMYFQMLGEHGFVGLGLFLSLGVMMWRKAAELRKRALDLEGYRDWVPQLMPMLQVALVGYAVGGAFQPVSYFDLIYYLAAAISLTEASMKEDTQARRVSMQPAAGRSASARAPLAPVHPGRGAS